MPQTRDTAAHREHEDFPWTIAVVDHAPRRETAEYRASRALMHKIVEELHDWVLAPGPYQDHHGGSIWLKDKGGWLFVQQPLGIEWSAQFCADPQKIDKMRVTAQRIVAGFPLTLPAYEELGYDAALLLLSTPITNAAEISQWTDSIFNASMPIPAAAHTGVYPHGAGYHHYPKPIVDIEHFRRDDFQLFVDDDGHPAVVVPMSSDPSDHRVRLIAAHPDAPHARLLTAEQPEAAAPPPPPRRRQFRHAEDGGALPPPPGQPVFHEAEEHKSAILAASDTLAQQAFARSRD